MEPEKKADSPKTPLLTTFPLQGGIRLGTPWVDQSCADCPGFPVLGAGDTPPPELHPGAPVCALA